MTDFVIRPDGDTTWQNAVFLSGTLPITAEDAAALGLSLGPNYQISRLGATASFSVTGVPAQMAAPGLSVSDQTITVTLAGDPATGGTAITGRDIRYSTDESSWTTIAGVTSPQDLTGLADATLYHVQTRAVNGNGAGAWSASASATTGATAGFTLTVTAANEIEIDGATGDLSITITAPAAYAGTYSQDVDGNTLNTATLTAAPQALVAPAITDDGSPASGEALGSIPGLWLYDAALPEPAISHQWQADTAGNGSFADIGGANAAAYTLSGNEAGDDVRLRETASQSGGGSRTATAAAISVAAAGGGGGHDFEDAFARADEAIETSPNWDLVWATGGASLDILSTALSSAASGSNGLNVARYTGTTANDQRVGITFRGFANGTYAEFGVTARDTSAGSGFTGYAVHGTSTGSMRLQRYSDGSSVTLDTHSHTIADGDLIEIECIGTAIKGYLNGAEVLSATSSHHSAGQPGIWAYQNNGGGSSGDDFFYDAA